MKSDTPDELFVFPDSPPDSSLSSLPVFDPDFRKREDYFLATLPWVPKTLSEYYRSEDDLPY